jgi:hypothetical protein
MVMLPDTGSCQKKEEVETVVVRSAVRSGCGAQRDEENLAEVDNGEAFVGQSSQGVARE